MTCSGLVLTVEEKSFRDHGPNPVANLQQDPRSPRRNPPAEGSIVPFSKVVQRLKRTFSNARKREEEIQDGQGETFARMQLP